MATKRRNGSTTECRTVHKAPARAPDWRRKVHLTLPADVADRLERIAVERRASPAVVVSDLVERCPIRPPAGDRPPSRPAGVTPAGPRGGRRPGKGRGQTTERAAQAR